LISKTDQLRYWLAYLGLVGVVAILGWDLGWPYVVAYFGLGLPYIVFFTIADRAKSRQRGYRNWNMFEQMGRTALDLPIWPFIAANELF